MRRRSSIFFLTALVLATSGCAQRDAVAPDESVVDPTVTDDPVAWTPCGAIECGSFTVPADHLGGESTAGVLDLHLFRRRSVVTDAPVLLLVGDRSPTAAIDARWGARALAERADLVLGSQARSFDIVSVALRGSAEMQVPAEVASMVGTLDVADDLELLRREGLGLDRVRVLAWGDGATAVAAWAMQHPSSIESAVLDSPADPATSLADQTEAQLLASDAAADWAVRWCASHLACPVNATPANTIELLDQRIEEGTASEGISHAVLARAAENALSSGSPNQLWNAITEAADRRGDLLAGLAGPSRAIEDARSLCRDVEPAGVKDLLALHDAARPAYFAVGSQRESLSLCVGTSEPARPIGSITENSAVVGARILVTGSAIDPVRPASIMKAMAKRNKWTWKPTPAMRHLVVGREDVPTAAAMDHLSKK